MATARRLRLPGHKLTTSWQGCESTFGAGKCECGNWVYDGWTEKMRDVRESHETHVHKVLQGMAAAKLPAHYKLEKALRPLPEGAFVCDCRNHKLGEWKPSKRVGQEPVRDWLIFYAVPVEAGTL